MVSKHEIDPAQLRHVGIMSVHNLTGDWESPFGVGYPSECAFNPSASGIIFFRWHRPGYPRVAAYNEVRFFKAADEMLRSNGGHGLDAVVIFGESGYRRDEEALVIAEGVKNEIGRDVFVLANVSQRRLPHNPQYNPEDPHILAFQKAEQDGIVDLTIGLNENYVPVLVSKLGLSTAGLKNNRFDDSDAFEKAMAIEDLYTQTHPGMFERSRINAEKLATLVPELPKGQHQLAWEKMNGPA